MQMLEHLKKGGQGAGRSGAGESGGADHAGDGQDHDAGDDHEEAGDAEHEEAGDGDSGGDHAGDGDMDVAAGDGPARGAQAAAAAQQEGGGAGIRPGVKLTAAISAAFAILRPYLPRGTVMTSGLRSDEDQRALINRMYLQKGGPANVTDINRRLQFLRQRGVKIAAPGSSPHRTGKAFDLSGAGLSSIVAAVLKCKREKREFKYTKHILEPKNNCVHVEVSG
jgi:hypothetical protein